jgi:hypothetical protein
LTFPVKDGDLRTAILHCRLTITSNDGQRLGHPRKGPALQAGKLEYRDGAVWGNPYLRVLRSQLELYIVAQLGSEYLVSKKSQTELRAISKEIADLRKKLAALEARKTALEREIKT